MSAGSLTPSKPDASPLPVPPEHALGTAPLLLWLLVQLGATLLAVLRVPLAAAYPEPAEQLAPYLLLGVQVVASGMLFPFLLREWRITVQVIATAVPFQLAAGYLAGLEARAMLPAMAFVLSWILVLGLWKPRLKRLVTQMLGVCVATCLTLGGGILRYLCLEFAPVPGPGTYFETATPLLTTLATLDGQPAWPGWLLLAGLAAGALCAAGFARNMRRKTLRKSVEIA